MTPGPVPASPAASPRRAIAAGLALSATAFLLGVPAADAARPWQAASESPALNRAANGQCSDGTGTAIPQTPKALTSLQSALSWESSRGEGVVVAVVDSGVDGKNPHLRGVLAGGVDLVGDNQGQSGYADHYGHGTAIAGAIAARSVEGSGLVGLAPQARILSVRVFAGTSDEAVKNGFGPSIARTAQGIRYAADHQAQVINVSLSTPVPDGQLRDAVRYAQSRGSLVVASSGNQNPESNSRMDASGGPATAVRYPAGFPGVVGVAAANDAGVADGASVHGSHVAVTAPGQQVLTSATQGIDCVYASEVPASSYATAYASAAAALVAAVHPDEKASSWAWRLETSAVRADPRKRDDVNGWGLIQPYEAITLVRGNGVPGPPDPLGSRQPAAAPPGGDAVVVPHGDPARQQMLEVAGYTVLGGLIVLGIVGTLAAGRRRRRNNDGVIQR